jgi:hypothetical protein
VFTSLFFWSIEQFNSKSAICQEAAGDFFVLQVKKTPRKGGVWRIYQSGLF